MTGESASKLIELLCSGADEARSLPPTVLIAAHPDDEAVSAGSRLPRLRQATFVHVTDGAPRDGRDATAHGFATREEYAAARRQEVLCALALAGIGPEQARQLGYVDQEPSLHLADLSRRTAALLRQLRPRMVLTHPYEGGHPDHDATAFAVHAAAGLIAAEGLAPPVLIEMTGYHNSPGGIETGVFLPADGCEAFTLVLSEADRQFKRQVIACHATQRETLRYFAVDVERFRPAPRYDFARPPHEGTLFYEMYPWGMTGERFGKLVREALEELGIGAVPI